MYLLIEDIKISNALKAKRLSENEFIAELVWQT